MNCWKITEFPALLLKPSHGAVKPESPKDTFHKNWLLAPPCELVMYCVNDVTTLTTVMAAPLRLMSRLAVVTGQFYFCQQKVTLSFLTVKWLAKYSKIQLLVNAVISADMHCKQPFISSVQTT